MALHPDPAAPNAVVDLVKRARYLADARVPAVWLAQLPTTEALSLAPLLAAAEPRLRLGTSVVTMNPRHPLVVGTQARIAQAATGGRFTLGIGLGGSSLESSAYGLRDAARVARLEEFLRVLAQVRQGGPVDYDGDLFHAHADAPAISGGDNFELLVAAMAPRTLRLAGALADGTLTNLAGPRTIENFIRPSLRTAAQAAGRAEPRIVAVVTALVTDDVDQAMRQVAEAIGFYSDIPSYRAVMDREGVAAPADLALIGSAAHVRAGLETLLSAGADEIIVSDRGLGTTADRHATYDLLADMST